MIYKRENWVDNIKVVSCTLVVFGHFFQSMVKANILPDNFIYRWFDNTIYYFHVPLFFICSGYLYQKYTRVDSWRSWATNIRKKAIALGIPYFAFSLLTWIIKTVFASTISNGIGGLWDTLFVNPYPPYWYLYILFLIFVITPTIQSVKMLFMLLTISLVFKVVSCLSIGLFFFDIYAIQGVMANEIWFLIGMCVALTGAVKLKHRVAGALLLICFVGISFVTVKVDNGYVDFIMGIMACAAVFMIMIKMKDCRGFKVVAQYTMPIFLMHTLIAAPVRIIMVKIGIYTPVLHVVMGLLASFIGSVIAFILMKKVKLDFFVFPRDYIKKRA